MKRIIPFLITALLFIGLTNSCDELPIDSENESGPQVKTLEAVQGQFFVVTVTGKVNGLEAVALDFECGVEYSTDPSFSKDSTIRVKANVNYSDNEYTVILSPLESGRKYYYRAYYVNQLLIYYGEVKDFTFTWSTASLIGYWKGTDDYFYTFNDDRTGERTDSLTQALDYEWRIVGDELTLLHFITTGTPGILSYIYTIQSITDNKIEMFEKGDDAENIITLTRIEESDLPQIDRTILMYIAADNNLSPYANSIIYSIRTGLSSLKGNMLVFVDRKDVAPTLLRIHDMMIDTIKVYSELNSADPATLSNVISYVKDNYKTESYGLILWGHGMGWLPTSQYHFVAHNRGFVQTRGYADNWTISDQNKVTKGFAMENMIGETPAYTCMELDELVEAIPDELFDFIAFDACFMGNIEVIYALRNKAKYIISSSCESLIIGYPYHLVTKDFMLGDLLKMCSEYYTYYNSMSNSQDCMACISLVNTEGLDSLANCYKKIMAEKNDTVASIDISNIQCFDSFSNHVFFDLENFVANLNVSREYLNEFRLQLESCVTYKASTTYIYPNINVYSFCGLSVFIPLFQYESSGLNDEYRKTEWSKSTAYIGTILKEEMIVGSWSTDTWDFVFNDDNTGSYTDTEGTFNFTWSLHYNELELKFSDEETTISLFFIIQSISETTLKVYIKDLSTEDIIVFTKTN